MKWDEAEMGECWKENTRNLHGILIYNDNNVMKVEKILKKL